MSQLALDFGHRAALGADDFLIADSNRGAVLWLDRWPDWPAPALTIHGPPGCGKTHLAHVWQASSSARRLTASEVAGRTPAEVLGEWRYAVVDDIDPTRLDEQALLHLFNVVAERGGHLLILAEAPPARWPIGLPDLRSRLAAAPAVAIGAPDDALIGAVLAKLFIDRQLRVGEEVVSFLLARMERSLDGARRIVAALDAAALTGRRNITIPLTRQVLNEIEVNDKGS